MAERDREGILGLDNIRLDLPVAGLGSRTLAAFLDYLCLLVVTAAWFAVCLGIGVLDAGWGIALMIIGVFLLQWGYFALQEMAMGGRTLGKRVVGLRVVSAEGASPGTGALLMRNLVRLLEVVFGVPLMAIDPLSRRLGDRLAGTLVVHERRRNEELMIGRIPPGWGAREVGVVESFLSRQGELADPGQRAELAGRLLARVERDAPHFLEGVDRRDPVQALRLALQPPGGEGTLDYARFVRLRRPVWETFERQLEEGRDLRRVSHNDLEEMAFRYRQVLHDHALAAARYPRTGAARRLRELAVEGMRRLTQDERESSGGLRHFFTRTFPAAFRRQLGLLGVTTGLFALGAVIGLVLGNLQPGLGAIFLGAEAFQGLAEGEMWTDSLVTTMPPSLSTSRIATNNIGVSLMAWGGGLLAGLVPLWVVLFNGFMLGTIISVTAHYSMAGRLLEFVSAHGFLEISLILVMAAAGLGIGRAIVAAGERPRSVALREAGREALVVLLGCVPWFVVLALVEVLVSPSPELAPPFKVALGLVLELLFLTLALGRPARRSSHE